MVSKKLVSFYNFISLGVQQSRTKVAQLSYDVAASIHKGTANTMSPGESLVAESQEGDSCCVCLSRLKDGEDVHILPCLHKFHKMCVDRWFDVCTRTCPLCRFSMVEENSLRSLELTEEMGGFVDDFLSHLMCCCCALVQEWREVEIRGMYGPEKTKTSPPPSQFMES